MWGEDATVEELVCRARSGDEAAWFDLVTRFDRMVHAVTSGFHLQNADVADVVQTTWLTAFEKLGSLREPARFGGWLRTIARNACVDLCVRADRERPVEDAGHAAEEPSPGPEALALRAETRRAVEEAVADLPNRSRILVECLFSTARADYAGVARETGIPLGGIGPTRARALTQLRNGLARRGHGPVPTLAEAG